MAKSVNPRVSALGALADRLGAMGDHKVTLQLQSIVNRLRSGAEALDRVNATRSPLDTTAAHALKVGKLARKFDSEITAALNEMARIAGAACTDARNRLEQKVNLKPDAHEKEIREVFRSLDSTKRAELLKELIDQNRGPEFAAIVRAPALLTGLTDAQRGHYEQSFVSRYAAAEVAEIEMMENCFGEASEASKTAALLVKDLTDPGYLARIEREAADADAAGAAFNESLQ